MKTDIRSESAAYALIERAKGDVACIPQILELLDLTHDIYSQADSPTVTRIRGALIAALAEQALPDDALPIVLAELETASDAWLTAIAAATLRRRPVPSASFVEPLLMAEFLIRHRDDNVVLKSRGGYDVPGEATSATLEILRTITWLGPAGHAATARLKELAMRPQDEATMALLRAAIDAVTSDAAPLAAAPDLALIPVHHELTSSMAELLLEDHAARQISFGEFFLGHTTVVVFFFTRCGNPAKCPATIARLGRLQGILDAETQRVRTAGFTYDPAYDEPARLSRYASSWGARLDDDNRLFRCQDGYDELRRHFALGVSYGPSGITQHDVEAFVVDRRGSIVGAVRRRCWSEQALMDFARTVSEQPSHRGHA